MGNDIFLNKKLIELGINSNSQTYIGPWLVAFDLTNICNNNCKGCWCFSSEVLEKKKQFSDDNKNNKFMPFDLVIKTIDELSDLGIYSINLSGGGEPMMHPHFKEIFLYLKQKGFEVNLNTNFTLARKDDIEDFLNLRLNHIHISLWAGDVETYCEVYPNRSPSDFDSLKNHIKYLTGHKYRFPVNIYFVINSLNYNKIDKFIGYALDTFVDTIEFTLIDIEDPDLKYLDLSNEQKKELYNYFSKCKFKNNQISELPSGFKPNTKLNIINLNPLLKKLGDTSLRKSTLNLVNSIPCLIGWTYTRIMYDGLVLPCCKAYKFPMGDLYKSSFKDIWFGKKYTKFRENAKSLPKDSKYFSKIDCMKSCDNYINNIETITNFGKDKFRLEYD